MVRAVRVPRASLAGWAAPCVAGWLARVRWRRWGAPLPPPLPPLLARTATDGLLAAARATALQARPGRAAAHGAHTLPRADGRQGHCAGAGRHHTPTVCVARGGALSLAGRGALPPMLPALAAACCGCCRRMRWRSCFWWGSRLLPTPHASLPARTHAACAGGAAYAPAARLLHGAAEQLRAGQPTAWRLSAASCCCQLRPPPTSSPPTLSRPASRAHSHPWPRPPQLGALRAGRAEALVCPRLQPPPGRL